MSLCSFILATACTQEMANQPRYDTFDKSTFYRDALSSRPLPAGVIPRNEVNTEQPQLTMALLERGRERYDIYCAPCHGYTGRGDGMAARRGYRLPVASFHNEKLRAVGAEQLYTVITDGFGAMPPYRHQIEPRDRWAIAAYIRALQLSQWAPVEDVPQDERRKIESVSR